MNKIEKENIRKTIYFVSQELGDENSGHDFAHIKRVVENSLVLAKSEKTVNKYILIMTALLHDIDDKKVVHKGLSVKEFLSTIFISKLDKETIIDNIARLSFSVQKTGIKEVTLEGKITSDADKLDALGNIGIVRTFTYGAIKNRPIYNKEDLTSCTIGHFYEKLFKLKDFMYLEKSKQIADKKIRYMKQFIKLLIKEIDGTFVNFNKLI